MGVLTCLNDVPMQSQPVSPPPMMTMSLFSVNIDRWSTLLPDCFFCQVSRKLTAKWIPCKFRPTINSQPMVTSISIWDRSLTQEILLWGHISSCLGKIETWNWEISWPCCTRTKDDSIVVMKQLFRCYVFTDMDSRLELDTFGYHQFNSALYNLHNTKTTSCHLEK